MIAGSGPAANDLEALAGSLNLQNVRFTGFLDRDAQKAVWENTLFSIVPSMWQEPFGMVVLEAWAQGRRGGRSQNRCSFEIITDGVDGFLADPSDTSHLAETLERAFASVPKLAEMGRSGFGKLKSHYNRQRWLGEIRKVFGRAADVNPEAFLNTLSHEMPGLHRHHRRIRSGHLRDHGPSVHSPHLSRKTCLTDQAA